MAMKANKAVEDFRTVINDRVSPFKHEEAVVLVWINDSIREIFRRRPDSASSNSVTTTLPAELVDISATGENLPVNDFFKEAVVHFLCFKAYLEQGDIERSNVKWAAFLGSVAWSN